MAGNKWLSTYLENDRRDLPAFTAVNVLTDARTGMPLAVLEGQSVTARRTAGHAGVGARYLARPDSETVAIIGCGDQGTAFLRLVADLFDLAAVRVCNRDEERRQSFVAEMSDGIDARFEPTGDPREAVDGADVVCTATTAERPVVQEEWVDPGTHVAAVSGFLDLDPAFSRSADRWVVGWHDRDLTWIEGDEQGRLGPETLSATDVYADVTEIMSGERSGRSTTRSRNSP